MALEALSRICDEATLATARKRFSGLLTRKEEKTHWAGMLAASGSSAALEKLTTWIEGPDPMRAALAVRVAGLCSGGAWAGAVPAGCLVRINTSSRKTGPACV